MSAPLRPTPLTDAYDEELYAEKNSFMSDQIIAALNFARELERQNAELLAALKLFTCASMGGSNGDGESHIGWQKSQGISAAERLVIARALIAKIESSPPQPEGTK